MDNDQRIRRIQSLGYTADEAAFLCVAGLNSGYFVRRQYSAFSGRSAGYADMALGEKALRFGHATATAMRHNRLLYRLYSRPFYAAMGEEDNRNRRARPTQAIKRRLMILDFVIANPGLRFLPTEAEKVVLFRDELGIGADRLPSKLYRGAEKDQRTIRYFVDKSPIYIDPGAKGGSRPTVHFCYVDEGLHSTSGFEQYLSEYRLLFASLERVEVVYLACDPGEFAEPVRVFARLAGTGNRAPVDPLVARIIEHFNVLDAYERRDMTGLNQAKLIQLRADRAEFSGARYERLFEQWKQAGEAGIVAALCPESLTKPERELQFRTHLLPFRYELFGLHTGSKVRQGNSDADRK